jgi:asparagine synthase (glutamine-hydrolysing)
MIENIKLSTNIRQWVDISTDCKVQIWISGYLFIKLPELSHKINNTLLDSDADIEDLSDIFSNIKGHFSIVIQFQDILFALVDRIRSIPLYYSTNISNCNIVISDTPSTLLSYDSVFAKNIESSMEIAMSGYTIGNKTLYKGIYQLNAGECLIVNGASFTKKSYYNYLPIGNKLIDRKTLSSELLNITINVMKDVIDSCNNRQIVVPLSAGKDSRLIVSALRNLNYKNVKCFSYGKKNSSDMIIGKKLAERMNYEWMGVSSTDKKHKNIFNSSEFKQYKNNFETLSSAPFYQDFYAVSELKNSGWIDDDAIFINGNTGDFLSGGHITKKLLDGNIKDLYNEFLEKHYNEWKFLRNFKNDSVVVDNLKSLFSERVDRNICEIPIYSMYEFYEWIGRQSKHITLMQQCYNFFGHEWRMPLWDNRLMDFWEKVPVDLKYKQKLYKDVFIKENWANVWNDIDINPNNNKSPVMFLRLLFKFLFLFLGKDRWHTFDDKYFKYFLNPTNDYFMLGYLQWLLDTRGSRDARSWRIELYLNSHNINLNNLNQ